jgi:hypothetical protein
VRQHIFFAQHFFYPLFTYDVVDYAFRPSLIVISVRIVSQRSSIATLASTFVLEHALRHTKLLLIHLYFPNRKLELFHVRDATAKKKNTFVPSNSEKLLSTVWTR